MQQRGVIITAIILAIILAGALWYTLTRDNTADPELTASPTPSPAVAFESITPAPEAAAPTVTPVNVAVGQSSDSVSPTAASGTQENILTALAVVTLAGAWYLARTITRSQQF